MSKQFAKIRSGISYQGLASDPSDATNGDFYYNTTSNAFRQYTGGTWSAIPSGAAITALTGDVTASGPGSAAATLATVNSNTGSFGSSTAIPSFTVNGKGLITAASTSAVVAPAGTLTGTTLASNVVTSSLTSVGTLGSLSVTGNITNAALTASQAVVTDGSKNLASLAYTSASTASTLVERDSSSNFSANVITATLNGNANTANSANNFTGSLSGDITGTQSSTAVSEIAGTTVSGTTGSGNVVFSTSPTLVTPALGTPSALVGTNITGTATSFTASNVTTNANLTGVITSVGNATSIASQTGTGSKFVVDTSPTITTPTFTTSATTALLIGGTTASSTLTLESTSGSGSSDSIIFKTGSQSTRMTIFSNGGVTLGNTAQISSNPSSGELGFANGNAIRWVNGAGTSFLNTMYLDSSNNLNLGGGGAVNNIVFSVGGINPVFTLNNTSGLAEFNNNIKVDGTYSSPFAVNSSTSTPQNNVSTSNSGMQFTGNATITVNNLAAGVDGQRFTIVNSTLNTMSFPYNDSTGGGTIILNSTGTTVTLPYNGSLDFVYTTHNGTAWYIIGK